MLSSSAPVIYYSSIRHSGKVPLSQDTAHKSIVSGHVKGPVRLLPCKWRVSSNVSWLSSDGTVPVKLLYENNKFSRFVSSPKMVGIVSVRLFCFIIKVSFQDCKQGNWEMKGNTQMTASSTLTQSCKASQFTWQGARHICVQNRQVHCRQLKIQWMSCIHSVKAVNIGIGGIDSLRSESCPISEGIVPVTEASPRKKYSVGLVSLKMSKTVGNAEDHSWLATYSSSSPFLFL